ncbi:MAG TPA: hypothetical protein VHG89_09590 [Verrucomicrobiae bacterium]|nr:hypothetical protein [Verrucomicrobiae bacterium]
MENRDAEFEIRRKRVMEKKWCLMVELPGYKEWAGQYKNLDCIIPNLEGYHILVHPEEFSRPLAWIFEREYKSWLADFAERGGPRRDLNEFKKD